ncbi:WSSV550 [White spot syndrome virus]|uniref:WSSV550 n=1 Tax=White spot syndrome virus TaxID=342409 RepID=A0A2I6SCJ0_9VIRU|nr:WSSV550 [White spot syndrome virus]
MLQQQQPTHSAFLEQTRGRGGGVLGSGTEQTKDHVERMKRLDIKHDISRRQKYYYYYTQ